MARILSNRNFPSQWWECKIVQPVWWFLVKLNMLLLYNPEIVIGTYPKEFKYYIHTKTNAQ